MSITLTVSEATALIAHLRATGAPHPVGDAIQKRLDGMKKSRQQAVLMSKVVTPPADWDTKALELARTLDWRLARTRPEQRVNTMHLSVLAGIQYGAEYSTGNPVGRIIMSSGTMGVHWTDTTRVRGLPEGTNLHVKTGFQP